MFCVVHIFYNYNLLVWLATNCCQKLVTTCSRDLNWISMSMWHRLCILARYFGCWILHLDIIIYINHFHLSLIHCWIYIRSQGVITCLVIVQTLHLQRKISSSLICTPQCFFLITWNHWRVSCSFCLIF
jgi:hypothetical protein